MTKWNVLRHAGYTARIEFDAEDRLFHGRVLGIRDVIHFSGVTVDQLERGMKDSIEDYLAWHKQLGQEPEAPFSGKTLLRFPEGMHERAALAAATKGESLNEFIVEAIRQRLEARPVVRHGAVSS